MSKNSYQGTKINPTKFHTSQLKFFVILLPMAVFMALPIIYIMSTAFKPFEELFAYPPRFIVLRPTFENFNDLVKNVGSSMIPFSRYVFNSLTSALVVVAASVAMSLSAGYILSKKEFRGKKLLFSINTISLMFVPVAVRIPRYLLIEKAGLLDSFWILFLPLLAMPVGLFLIKQFIDQMPDSLIEAAKVDGANDFTILHKIVAPIVTPALVTVAILAFQAAWNTADASTYYINSDSLKTMAFFMSALAAKAGNEVAGQGMIAASSLILFIPNLVIFISMQSKVLNTMAHSGIK